ncbi:MAG: hypothetical protein KDE53_03375 [Caldilineaceae bacterium]|nr:hypothetical protein [Caldilineaceae bacterium]HRW08662.1 hypothetical protein [Caldilineaceae bacterium]
MIEIKYTGTDLVIPKDTIEEQLGYRPGDVLRVIIPSKVQLSPLPRLPEVVTHMRETLEAVGGSWSSEDAEHFQQMRQELWTEWQIPKSV